MCAYSQGFQIFEKISVIMMEAQGRAAPRLTARPPAHAARPTACSAAHAARRFRLRRMAAAIGLHLDVGAFSDLRDGTADVFRARAVARAWAAGTDAERAAVIAQLPQVDPDELLRIAATRNCAALIGLAIDRGATDYAGALAALAISPAAGCHDIDEGLVHSIMAKIPEPFLDILNHALRRAVLAENELMIALLLEHGANDYTGALYSAVCSHSGKMIDTFVKLGGEVTERTLRAAQHYDKQHVLAACQRAFTANPPEFGEVYESGGESSDDD